MISTTGPSYIFILMVYIDFYVKFSKWDHNYLVITARSIDCPENSVAVRYYNTFFLQQLKARFLGIPAPAFFVVILLFFLFYSFSYTIIYLKIWL